MTRQIWVSPDKATGLTRVHKPEAERDRSTYHLRQLREKCGYSQAQVAQELGVSRPTYLQIEKGERELTVPEAQKLASLYGMSLEELVSEKKKETSVEIPAEVQADSKPPYRISVPRKNLKKFKEVLLYILEKVGAKKNIGETALYKILYFIDFDFYEKFEEQLIGATYIKNHYGPTPVEFRGIARTMLAKKELLLVKSKYFDYDQKKYLPLRKPDLSVISALEKEHIDWELQRLSDMNGSELREFSHGDIPWKIYEPGEKLSYESVFYRDKQYSQRSYDNDPL
ncbi:MAG: helix-turn-helix domain-containing protein [Candidatus Peribacteraceae bacterium]